MLTGFPSSVASTLIGQLTTAAPPPGPLSPLASVPALRFTYPHTDTCTKT